MLVPLSKVNPRVTLRRDRWGAPVTRVLQVGALKPSLEHTLETKYDALVLPDGPKREAFLAEHAESIRIVVTSGRHGVDTTLMEAYPRWGLS